MTEEKKQELEQTLADRVTESILPEVETMLENARKAGRAEANEQIRLALFNLDEDDPVKANIARAREILLGVIGAELEPDAASRVIDELNDADDDELVRRQ